MVFTLICKWWCSCLDQCFEIVGRPWEHYEVPYRRMLCGIFGQAITVQKAYKFLMDEPGGFKNPKTYAELRSTLHGITFHYWRLNRKNMTPSWPQGSAEFIDEVMERFLGSFALTTVLAFKMMYGIGCERIPKHELPKKVGVSKEALYAILPGYTNSPCYQ